MVVTGCAFLTLAAAVTLLRSSAILVRAWAPSARSPPTDSAVFDFRLLGHRPVFAVGAGRGDAGLRVLAQPPAPQVRHVPGRLPRPHVRALPHGQQARREGAGEDPYPTATPLPAPTLRPPRGSAVVPSHLLVNELAICPSAPQAHIAAIANFERILRASGMTGEEIEAATDEVVGGKGKGKRDGAKKETTGPQQAAAGDKGRAETGGRVQAGDEPGGAPGTGATASAGAGDVSQKGTS